MLINSVLKSAQPYLQGSRVRDVVVGISLIAVELDSGFIGVSYVLREGLGAGCSIFPYLRDLEGTDSAAVAEWAVTGADDLQRAVGIAVLAAASRGQDLEDSAAPDSPLGVKLRKKDTVGMIGLIRPVAGIIRSQAKELYIFDKGVSKCGGVADAVLPVKEQSRLLPHCDVVILSGTTLINGTADKLLELCEQAREVIMMGASTPIYPEAFAGTRVTLLAGSWWKEECKKSIFKKISHACGIRELGPYSLKQSVKVYT